MGQIDKARITWQALLRRFPYASAAADAYYSLERQKPALRAQLLQRLPAHPAALASAMEISGTEILAHEGVLYLAN